MPRSFPLAVCLLLLPVLDVPAAAQEEPQEFRDLRAELFLALEMNDLEAARQVLAEGAADEINRGNPSPLTTAVLLDNLNMAALLLRAGGDPDVTEDSPLLAAIRTDSVDMMRLLFHAGARLRAGEIRELLELALRSRDALAIYGELVDRGADVELALRVAVENRKLDAALSALERGADVSALGELDLLAQTNAPRARFPEILELAVREDNREAALSYFLAVAAATGDRPLARQVLDRGGQVSLEHLERAEEQGQDDVARFFLEQLGEGLPELIARAEAEGRGELAAFLKSLRLRRIGSVVGPAVAGLALLFVLAAIAFFVRKNVQLSPRKLFRAVARGDRARLEKLLDAGAAADAPHRGEPALYVATRRDDLKAARLLLRHGADVNRRATAAAPGGDSGWAPIHVAARNGNVSLVELFLRHGAEIDARSANGRTPLDLAQVSHRSEIVHLLLERGAAPATAGDPQPAVPARAGAAPSPPFEDLVPPPPDPPDPPDPAPAAGVPRPSSSFAPSVIPSRVIPHPTSRKKNEPG